MTKPLFWRFHVRGRPCRLDRYFEVELRLCPWAKVSASMDLVALYLADQVAS